MKGYSFRSLTDLVLKIFKTKVNAGTGLSGGGSLEADRTLTVKYGTAAGTAAQGNDSRLSNSREWIAATIPQAESEAGTATTRRAFTALRVRQAIVAWWASISGVFGRDLITSANNTVARSKLGLGTAATRNVGEGTGNVLERGSFGLGHAKLVEDFTDRIDSGFYLSSSPSSKTPPGMVTDGGWMINLNWHHNDVGNRYNCSFYGNVGENFIGFRRIISNGVPQDPVELYHTGNMPVTALRWPSLAEVTGTPANYPTTWNSVAAKPAHATRWPTFAEVTGKPATYTPSSHTHPWAQVTGQPVTATRWPTFAEVTGKPSTYTPSSHTHPVSQVTGLGSAATRNVGTAVGQVVERGSFGLGRAERVANFAARIDSGFYLSTQGSVGQPSGMVTDGGWMINLNWHHNDDGNRYNCSFYGNVGENFIGFRRIISNGVPQDPVELYHTGNMPVQATRWPTLAEVSGKPANYPTNWATVSGKPIVQTVGTSTTNLMSQAAVTDQLAIKASTSTQVIAGTGLTGGGNLTTNRTLSIAASHIPIGVGQTWQDMAGNRQANVSYTNTTGRPIEVAVSYIHSEGNNAAQHTFNVSGVVVGRSVTRYESSEKVSFTSAIVPAGANYSVTGASGAIFSWVELR